MKFKKFIFTASLSISILAIAGSAYATTYGPFSPVVPSGGGNWYSAAHPASGTTQNVDMGSIGGDHAMYGTVNDSSKHNISSETPLPENNETDITSTATVNQSIMLMLETGFWNPVDTQCTFSWTP